MLHVDQHNEMTIIPILLNHIQQGRSIAYVSEAGTPAISDPGAILVSELRKHNIPICALPGASAVTTLVSAAGLSELPFTFTGFIPKKDSEKHMFFDTYRKKNIPILCYESPKRLEKTLHLLQTLPIDTLVIGKELTKTFEAIWSGPPKDVIPTVLAHNLKGEWCLLIQFTPYTEQSQIHDFVTLCKDAKINRTQMIALGKALYNYPKNQLYSLWETT